MTSISKFAPSVVLIAAIAITAAGCGAKKDNVEPSRATETVKLALDWFPNPDHAAIYTAMAEGSFKDLGLEVEPVVPSDPSAPIKQVASGQVDLAISYEPEVFLAREQGLQVVAIAAIVQEPLTSLMALKSKRINSAKDLRGKRVGTAGIPYQSAYLKTILDKAGVNPASVEETSVGTNLMGAMLTGKVDATLGGFWNVEGIELGLRKRPAVVIPVNRLGVPSYDELVLVANEKDIAENASWLHLFIAAMTEGAKAAQKDPGLAVKALLEANDDLDPKLVSQSVKETVPVLFPKDRNLPLGYLNALEWESYGNWMADSGLLKRRPEVAKAMTDKFLVK